MGKAGDGLPVQICRRQINAEGGGDRRAEIICAAILALAGDGTVRAQNRNNGILICDQPGQVSPCLKRAVCFQDDIAVRAAK